MLQLRQRVDKILDDMGLDFLHLERVDGSGLPLLASVCGQPVIYLQGIVLPSKLTKNEREYAEELISNYLYENKEDIDWIIEQKRNPIELEEVTAYNISCTYSGRDYRWQGGKKILNKVTARQPTFELFIEDGFTVKKNGKVYAVKAVHWIDNKTLFNHLSNLDEYQDALTKYEAAWKKKQKIDDRIAKLSKCQV